MTKIFIIHGAYGSPEENWIPWLKKELEKLGYIVIVPKFPTPKGQNLEAWKHVFNGKELDKNSVVVGHSLGVTFLLHLLEKEKIKSGFFIAGFTTFLNNPEFDKINKTFVEKEFDWKSIKQNCSSFTIYHSESDPYVPLKMGKNISKKMDENFIVVQNAGHFNTEVGYTTFPALLQKIKNSLNIYKV